jgi:hypothetical protein
MKYIDLQYLLPLILKGVFMQKEFICLDYIFIIFSFACILSLILLASPIPACFYHVYRYELCMNGCS